MYTTVAAVRLALAPLSTSPDYSPRQDTAAGLSDDQLEDAIREADAKIDSYLLRRYVVPVEPLSPDVYPGPIGFWSRDLAAYYATLTLYRNTPMESTNPVFLRMQGVVVDLIAVRDGKSALDIPVSESPSSSSGFAGVVNLYDDPLLSPEDWGVRPTAGTRIGSGDDVAW